MTNNYKRTHQIIAYIVLLGLFLQSCSPFSNQPLLRVDQTKGQKKAISFAQRENIDSLVDREFTAEKGCLFTFYEQDGNLQANVKIDASQKEPNYTNVPVVLAQGVCLIELPHLDRTIQRCRIQVERTSTGKPGRIVVVRGGLKGGMMEGDTQSPVKKLTQVVGLRSYFRTKVGYLELSPQNYETIMDYCSKQEYARIPHQKYEKK